MISHASHQMRSEIWHDRMNKTVRFQLSLTRFKCAACLKRIENIATFSSVSKSISCSTSVYPVYSIKANIKLSFKSKPLIWWIFPALINHYAAIGLRAHQIQYRVGDNSHSSVQVAEVQLLSMPRCCSSSAVDCQVVCGWRGLLQDQQTLWPRGRCQWECVVHALRTSVEWWSTLNSAWLKLPHGLNVYLDSDHKLNTSIIQVGVVVAAVSQLPIWWLSLVSKRDSTC